MHDTALARRELVLARIRPFVLRARLLDDQDLLKPWHADLHDCHHLIGVIDGTVVCAGGGGPRRCRPGEVLLRMPGEGTRGLRLSRGTRLVAVAFDLTVVPLRASGRGLVHRGSPRQPSEEELWGHRLPRHVTDEAGRILLADLLTIESTYWRTPADRLRACARLLTAIGDLLAMVDTTRPWGEPASPRSRAAMAEHEAVRRLPYVMKVAEMAAYVGWSVDHFTRRYRQRMGCSPKVFLDRLRWREAQRLLADGNLAIGEIAALLGYRSTSAFSNACKQALGLSPRQYRDGIASRADGVRNPG